MRIVCLSAESADICARLGAWDDVIAVSAFASQEGLAPRPVIGGFSTADVDRIAGLSPHLVIAFSDVQAEMAAQLIRAGCTVLATNQRTLAEIAQTIRLIGRAIDRSAAGATSPINSHANSPPCARRRNAAPTSISRNGPSR